MFLHTPTDNVSEQEAEFPQQPLKQSHMINYPIIAYKSVTPDNRSIILANLAQDHPLRVIDLGQFQFVQFVNAGWT